MTAFYERYLKGVKKAQAAKTVISLAALLFVVLKDYAHVPVQKAAIITTGGAVALLFVYLIIPKRTQALMDNVAQELLLRQSDAAAIAAKVEAALPVSVTSDGTNTTATTGSAPPTATATVAPTPELAGSASVSTPAAAASASRDPNPVGTPNPYRAAENDSLPNA